jgi:hypothetical protein
MPVPVVGVFLVIHGLITTMIGVGAVTSPNAPAMTLPSWFSWWPGPFGRSWLVESLNLGTPAAVLGGLLWLVAGVALIGAGLGFAGFAPLRDQWPMLGLVGGVVGLVTVALYFHPLYLAAVVINLVIVVLVWGRVSTAS